MLTVGNIYYTKAVKLLMRTLKELLSGIRVIIVDGGYRGEVIRRIKEVCGYLLKVVTRFSMKGTMCLSHSLYEGSSKGHIYSLTMAADSA